MEICGLITLLIYFVRFIASANTNPLCPLTWVSSGYGNIPENSIEIAPGTNEFVSRVAIKNKWYGGRMSKIDGKAYVVHNEEQANFSTYEILTTSEKCEITWIPDSIGNLPEDGFNSVLVEENIYFGRATVNGRVYGGSITKGNNSLFYVSADGTIGKNLAYDILTSTYVKVNCLIDTIIFPGVTLSALETEYHKELISLEEVHNTGQTEWQHEIRHSQVKKETIQLKENKWNWNGINHLEINAPLWFGATDLFGTWNFSTTKLLRDRVIIVRDNEVSISTIVRVMQSQTFLQTCSFVTLLDNVPIEFEAVASFTSNNANLSSQDIGEILSASGRKVINLLEDRNGVIGEVKGVLVGRFSVKKSFAVSSKVNSGICYEIMQSNILRKLKLKDF